MKRVEQFIVAVALALPLVAASHAGAQRRIIGSGDEEGAPDEDEEGAPDAKGKDAKGKDAKGKDAKGKDAKGTDAKGTDAKGKDAKGTDAKGKDAKGKDAKGTDAKGADAKGTDAKGKEAKGTQGPGKASPDSDADVLSGTKEDQARRAREEEARVAAARAAEEAAEAERKKKEEEQRRLVEEKRAADEKRRLESRDQRLAAARKVRNLTRNAGAVGLSVAVEPGEVKANAVLELRVDVVEKLDVADPRYGALSPLKGLELVATVVTPMGKKDGAVARYVLHPLDAAGRYGFHFTPPRDGIYRVSIDGATRSGAPIAASFQLHAGVWPPPDFETEEKNNATATDALRTGRKVFSN